MSPSARGATITIAVVDAVAVAAVLAITAASSELGAETLQRGFLWGTLAAAALFGLLAMTILGIWWPSPIVAVPWLDSTLPTPARSREAREVLALGATVCAVLAVGALAAALAG